MNTLQGCLVPFFDSRFLRKEENEERAMVTLIERINFIIALVLSIAYFYQIVYAVVGFVRRKRYREPAAAVLHKYAVVVCARNEQAVIGELLQSLRRQKYPKQLLDLYVVADNCTDQTAAAARSAGARVYERTNYTEVGKGYALDYFFKRLYRERPDAGYEGYFVFDADNIVDENFVAEMNRTFDKGGYDAITSYRNSKNFGDNWISAGYSIWFLREARFLNFPRYLQGTNCAISGTGFLVSDQVVRANGGWPFHLLTEDIQFSASCAVEGRRIGYCDRAVVYDEQPVTMQQSWNQRMRWSKGFYQVDMHYGAALLKGSLRGGRRAFSCYDMLMTVAPGMLLTIGVMLLNVLVGAACFAAPAWLARQMLAVVGEALASGLLGFYFGMLAYGALTVFCEWKAIPAKASQKIGYLFTFPLFMLTYLPISLVALVRRVEWKPIQHTAVAERQQRAA